MVFDIMSEGEIKMEITNNSQETQQPVQIPPKVSQPPEELNIHKEVNVTLGMLVNIKKIIDISVTRGTFKSEELTPVGGVVDQLNTFISDSL